MKDPLRHRIWRELKHDIGKYIALFLFLMLTTGVISGFIVAGSSMIKTYNDSFEKYTIESGHFVLEDALTDDARAKVEARGVSVHELFYKEVTLDNENVIRIYKDRTEVDKVCLMDGAMPADGQIAVDRLYAENNSLAIGDTVAGLEVSGTVALSDYSALFKNNTDMMLDANKFSVAIVTDETFDGIDANLHYCYAWLNDDKSLDDQQCRDLADDIAEDLSSAGAQVKSLFDWQDNQAIEFSGDDMGGDKEMMIVLLYVVIVILGFVFGVTTRSTIEQESGTVGTLLASGYTRGELVRHYMSIPLAVTLAAAIVGNVLGYTVCKNVCAAMYYHSYSLPTYVTVWSAEAFIKTTIVPCVLIALVVMLVLRRMMRLPVQNFLRRDLRVRKKQYVPKLRNGGILKRFRTRVVLQNRGAYITLFVGILLANVLLIFGLIMPPVLSNFKAEVLDSRFSDYQYILKVPTLTENEDAEPFCVGSLEYEGEEISIYGIERSSEYVDTSDLPSYRTNVLVSDGFAEKFGLHRGDEITLKEKYGDKEYTLNVFGTKDYPASLAIFVSRGSFNELFGLESWFFNGYFSDEKLTDLDSEAVSTVITEHDLVVVADQLDDSMGRMFPMIGGFSLTLYMLLVYLLSKMIIEKNALSISMLKILGYSRREVSAVYNRATAIVVGVSLIVTIPLSAVIMKWLFGYFMRTMTGWVTFYIAPWIYPAMLAMGAAVYYIVHLIQTKRLDRIPMAQALKMTDI